MPTQLQLRRGTTAQNNAFTGAAGELSYDTEVDTLRVHDGTTAGGFAIASTAGTQTLTNKTLTSPQINTQVDMLARAELRFQDASGGQYVALEAPATISSSFVFTLPSADGSAGQALVTDGSGALSFAAAGATISSDTSTNTDFLLYFASTTSGALTAVKQDSGLTYNPSTETLTTTNFAGNASTATQLATARNIGGVSFNGTANINLPGVNTAGNQDTSGTAALATSVTITANNSTNETVYLTFVDGATGTQGLETDTGLSYNPSTNVLSTTASQAQYADLAERYSSDADYEPGTVLVFGGDAEVTQSTQPSDKKLAGVVSTDPAYLMNSAMEGASVALVGRVPCKVVGYVEKGDILVTSDVPGTAWAWREESNPPYGTVIGKSLEHKDSRGEGVIEVVVGVR